MVSVFALHTFIAKVYTLANGEEIEGKIIEVRQNGLLVIETNDKKIITYDFKEISLL